MVGRPLARQDQDLAGLNKVSRQAGKSACGTRAAIVPFMRSGLSALRALSFLGQLRPMLAKLAAGCSMQDVYVGAECAQHKQHLELSYPVRNGIVQARRNCLFGSIYISYANFNLPCGSRSNMAASLKPSNLDAMRTVA
jgi:hypothetical protein